MTAPNLFMRLGGADNIVRLVDEFYDHMEQGAVLFGVQN